MSKKRKAKNNAAFTLLEVLVAIAILSSVALVTVRSIGEHQRQVAETKWLDEVLYAGRAVLLDLVHAEDKDYIQRGTLAPDYPDVEWSSKLFPLRNVSGRRIELTLTDKQYNPPHTLTLEYLIP